MTPFLEDVNLTGISISPNGLNVTFEFHNMYDGIIAGNVFCRTVAFFSYHTTFGEHGSGQTGFPIYVGEVGRVDLRKDALRDRLRDLGYAFSVPGDPTRLPTPDDEVLLPFENGSEVVVEGGEVSIRVICAHVDLDVRSKQE